MCIRDSVNIVLNFIQVKAEKIVPFSIPIDGGIYVFPCAPIILKNIFYNIIIHIDKNVTVQRISLTDTADTVRGDRQRTC